MSLGPRHKLAERVARKWLKAAGAPRMPLPHIRVQLRNKAYMSGHARMTQHDRIHLSVGRHGKRREVALILAHELAHTVVFAEVRAGEHPKGAHHTPRFYWWFWRILPRQYWKDVAAFYHPHFPEYQPATPERVELLRPLGMGPLHPEARI
jgi:hypothetical protein